MVGFFPPLSLPTSLLTKPVIETDDIDLACVNNAEAVSISEKQLRKNHITGSELLHAKQYAVMNHNNSKTVPAVPKQSRELRGLAIPISTASPAGDVGCRC